MRLGATDGDLLEGEMSWGGGGGGREIVVSVKKENEKKKEAVVLPTNCHPFLHPQTRTNLIVYTTNLQTKPDGVMMKAKNKVKTPRTNKPT